MSLHSRLKALRESPSRGINDEIEISRLEKILLNQEQEVHKNLDEHFASHDKWYDEKLSRFHRSWVRKNSDKFYIVKRSEHLTGQPVYKYGNKIGPQYSARGEHVGWGGSYWSHTWEIHKITGV